MSETDQEREDEVLRRMLKTPPKPRKPQRHKDVRKAASPNADRKKG